MTIAALRNTFHLSETCVASDHILYTGRLHQVPAYSGQITLKRGVVRVM